MQRGSLIRSERKQGPAVWQFRWSDKGPDGRRIYRKRVIGTVDEYVDPEAARRLVKVLISEFAPSDFRMKPATMTVTELCKHFQYRELTNDNNWRSYSTKKLLLLSEALGHPQVGKIRAR
jgi:integrase